MNEMDPLAGFVPKFGVGQSVTRKEDPRLLRGDGRYTDDFLPEGQLTALFVRSSHAHAVLEKLDVEAARAAPGVVMVLTTAELSYLPDRRTAYENLALRTGVDGLKQISTVLIQAEKYGTPLGQAMRVVAQEGRDARLLEAERKAAALPPKLTVPMIVFFLPVLFAVILTPAIIQMSEKLM